MHLKYLEKKAWPWLFMAALAWAATPAMADPSVLSFGYHTLSGSFTSTGSDSGTFVATATSALRGDTALYTTGSVTRLVPETGSADFNFSSVLDGLGASLDRGDADFVLSMAVTNINQTTNTAVGNGTLVATDVDGDTITTSVSGQWVLINGQATFTGSASDVIFSDPTGTFNGQFNTSFSTDFSEYEQLVGVVTDVTGVSGGLFENEFSDHSSLVTSQLIPAPGAVLLGMIGLGLVGWVRRRFA